MVESKLKLTDTAQKILEERYYVGEEYEWNDICDRVAVAISDNEKESSKWYEKFKDILYNQKFLPNSPCLMNAGTDIGQLCACFVLPVEDSMVGIFDAIKNAALVNKTGGGTGFSFSRLRPKDSKVQSTNGVSSGPVSFIKVFNAATDVVKQGGRRRGANMGVLRVDHPDIIEFIKAKEKEGELANFNLSVALTDEFMEAVKNNYNQFVLWDSNKKEAAEIINPQELWNLITTKAHSNGEPGVLFIDAANRANPTPWLGDFESTNPCGEQWLLPYEACNLGSINLGLFVKDGKIDWDELERVTRIAVRFMDNVVDVSTYPIPEIEEATKKTRKLGLGIMGLHDLLIQLKVPYDSKEGRYIAANIMSFVHDIAEEESINIAKENGCFPAINIDDENFNRLKRNASLTSIQPTGTVSMIADCSSGCEPYYAVVTKKTVMDGKEFLLVNKHFERIAKEEGFYSPELMQEISKSGTVVGYKEIPDKYQELFKCSKDISVEGHIRMQAVLQPYVDSSISKTINMPNSSTVEDVKKAYMMAWELGCKGLTVYRDGSRDVQVLSTGNSKSEEEDQLVCCDTCKYDNEEYEETPCYKCDKTYIEWRPKDELFVDSHGCCKTTLPDVLNSKRFRMKGKDNDSVYISICYDDNNKPLEVFAKFPYENQPELLDKRVLWSTVCRLISLALRYGIPAEEVTKQLDKSSGVINDLPAQLSKLIKTFNTEKHVKNGCPECSSGSLIFEEGCVRCTNCGWSKCG